MENPMELSMVGSSPTFDPQCSFFEMEKMDMGVNFSITSCKEVDKEDDGKKMVVWEPKTSKECDASMRDSHIGPSPTLYDYAEYFTMEEVFATDIALKSGRKVPVKHTVMSLQSRPLRKLGKARRPRMRLVSERSEKKRVCTTGSKKC